MKRIGIILRDYESNNHNKLLGIRKDLIEYLDKYNVEIICLPINFKNNDFKRVEKGIKLCDGIILPGGDKNYEIDTQIVKFLYKKNIPTLGICLGMQIMALAFNGDLDYINNDSHQSNKFYVHSINIKKNSKLASIINNQNILVNSRHNEYITKTDLNIVAYSCDGIIEAIEDTNKKFFIGVQWHPESLKNDLYSKLLFDAFINSL
jgi:putative glutamine amidotransferase